MADRTAETDVKVLFERFNDAYQELRDAWLKTGGGMDMEVKIRDAAAEVAYQRRREAAKKVKRSARRG